MELPQSHRSISSAWQFVEAVDSTLRSELSRVIQETPFYGLSLDESTSQSVKKFLSIDLHLWRPGMGKHIYMLDFVEVPDTTAAGLIGTTKEVLAAFNAPLEKLIGAATDGASVFTGKLV